MNGAFPREPSKKLDKTINIGLSRFFMWIRYLLANNESAEQLIRFHFAKSLPGPPVLMTTEQDGHEVGRMILLERKCARAAPARCREGKTEQHQCRGAASGGGICANCSASTTAVAVGIAR